MHLIVQSRASVTELAGFHDGRIRIRLAAPPVDGAANTALLRFLARRLQVPGSHLAISAGHAGRRKSVIVRGVALEKVRDLLALGPYPA